jgi:hypothetical protein
MIECMLLIVALYQPSQMLEEQRWLEGAADNISCDTKKEEYEMRYRNTRAFVHRFLYCGAGVFPGLWHENGKPWSNMVAFCHPKDAPIPFGNGDVFLGSELPTASYGG